MSLDGKPATQRRVTQQSIKGRSQSHTSFVFHQQSRFAVADYSGNGAQPLTRSPAWRQPWLPGPSWADLHSETAARKHQTPHTHSPCHRVGLRKQSANKVKAISHGFDSALVRTLTHNTRRRSGCELVSPAIASSRYSNPFCRSSRATMPIVFPWRNPERYQTRRVPRQRICLYQSRWRWYGSCCQRSPHPAIARRQLSETAATPLNFLSAIRSSRL